MVKLFPNELNYINGLEGALKDKDRNARRATWMTLLKEVPSSVAVRLALKRALQPDMNVAVGVWKSLVQNDPSNEGFRREL